MGKDGKRQKSCPLWWRILFRLWGGEVRDSSHNNAKPETSATSSHRDLHNNNTLPGPCARQQTGLKKRERQKNMRGDWRSLHEVTKEFYDYYAK